MKVCEEAHREGNKLVHSMLPEKIALRVLNGEETCQVGSGQIVWHQEVGENRLDGGRQDIGGY